MNSLRAPGRVRPALRRHQPADLRASITSESAGHLRPRHRRAGAQGGAVPHVRHRPVPGHPRRPDHLGATTPTRRPAATRTRQRADTDRLAADSGLQRQLQLRAQLGEGRHRRLRRHDEVLRRRRRATRSSRPTRRRSPSCSPTAAADDRRAAARTSATPRTCSGCRPTCTAATTSPTRRLLQQHRRVGRSPRTRVAVGGAAAGRPRPPTPQGGAGPAARAAADRPVLPAHAAAGRGDARTSCILQPFVPVLHGRQPQEPHRVHGGQERSRRLRASSRRS